jgi:hypothetical protein
MPFEKSCGSCDAKLIDFDTVTLCCGLFFHEYCLPQHDADYHRSWTRRF